MDDIARLLVFCCAMFGGSFLFGMVPLSLSVSQRALRLMTLFGAGLLVGTSLAVIIPEGVHALYSFHAPQESSTPSGNPNNSAGHHGHHKGYNEHLLIGLSLCLGFVFMMLVDQVSGGGHSHQDSDVHVSKSWTATVGLVIHAVADGMALGSTATASKIEVEIIVFLAIILHKGPTAFGLTSFLLNEGCTRVVIRKYLLAFSCAAPIGALCTYFILNQMDPDSFGELNLPALAMLFSGGTFLFVATIHILPELRHSTQTGATKGPDRFSRCELAILIAGILVPVLLSVIHQH